MAARRDGPVARVRAALGRAPEWLVLLGAALSVAGMGALLVWFLTLSGMTEPVQFVYGGF